MPISKRRSGVLLPIFSLPGEYGIGSFGKQARQFVDLLQVMGFSYWQILPLCPVDEFYSPYKSASAFAGNPLYIDLETLSSWGLLDHQDLLITDHFKQPYQVDYSKVNKHRQDLFKKAYLNLTPKIRNEMIAFQETQSDWLIDYCLYSILAKKFNCTNWSKWPDPLILGHNIETIKQLKVKYYEEINFLSFLQYAFYKQWTALKSYANSKGIGIIGDIPIYVAYESADVWANPQFFQLDQQFQPINVAGVPPDYFSENGQLWGNPLYNWNKLKSDDYSWWFKRLNKELKMFDLVRIDHFRAFSAYWSIPSTANSAKNGKWVEGPGFHFFASFQKKNSANRIIAEDLGVQDDDLNKLLSQTQFPGMRIMSFAFLDFENNIHLPHNYEKNMIAYTGTHDNNTLLGTLFEYSDEQRNYALSYCQYKAFTENDWTIGGFKSASCRAMIETIWKSHANLTILPIQDLCGFGSDTIINKPGTVKTNWSFRITEDALAMIDHDWFYNLNRLYQRFPVLP
ncbi:4-alpha-glucanotransferase [Eubacteriaceae bacterium ES2]|nr:4-alpha-glucanotransferase [Eubacteriaceae bacterium ES2]